MWKLREFSLTIFWQKFREINGFTRYISKELIWRNISMVIENLLCFHTVLLHRVEISGFFWHSDFTWNQFWSIWSQKAAFWIISAVLSFEFFVFCHIFKREISNDQNSNPPKLLNYQFWHPKIGQNWFHVKLELQENY